MWTARLVLLAAMAVVALASEAADFTGHSVLRVVPNTREQLAAIHEYLQRNPQLDVWAEPRKPGKGVDVHVSPKQRQGLLGLLGELGLRHEVFIDDLHSVIQKQSASLRTLKADEPFGWTSYYTLEQIYEWMEQLAEKNSGKVSVVTIGKSYEERPIKGLVIKLAENLPVAIVESGIHAREWIGPASATYFIDQILKSTAEDAVAKYEWHIFPSVNPDGYAYTWSKNRNWRKTRSRNWLLFHGVDENRNWPFHWLEAGASSIPSLEDYGGPRAASEPETRALKAYVDQLAARTHVYVGLHSYSQMLMFPYGYTERRAPTHDKMLSIAEKAVAAVEAVAGKHFDYGNIAETIYTASGSTIDYVYSKCVPYPYVYELRDSGKYGFLLPADQILDGAREAWAGVTVIAEEALKDLPASNPATC